MSGIRIACPKCGKHLVLKDRRLLGRKGKCPACSHRFLLHEPAEEEVELQLVEAEPPEGVAPQSVPDDGPARESARRSTTQAGSARRADPPPPVPPESPAAESPAAESPGAEFPGAEFPAIETGFPAIDQEAAAPAADVPNIVVDTEGDIDRLRAIGRRGRKRRIGPAVIGVGVFLAAVAAAGFLIAPHLQETSARQPVPHDPLARGSGAPPAGQPAASDNASLRPVDADWVARLSPTSGEPIRLHMVPSGARLIVNFRPARLWSDDRQMAELRASLTEDFINWIAAQLESLCHRQPEQIEEVLITWILGARGTEPEVAAVVHLAAEERMSDLIEEFGGEPLDEFAQPKVYLRDETAVLIRDTRTFAICPRSMAADLAETLEQPNLDTSDGLLEVLELTDRDRLVTVAFEPADLQRHLRMLVPESAHPLLDMASRWLADHAETVGWSLHTGEEFHSEIILRGPATVSPVRTESEVRAGLEGVPRALVPAVRKMTPRRLGFRRIIGRFPAMLEVFRMATLSSLEGRMVRLITVLPPKAAPNLALGTILAWDEATRTDFSAAPPALAADQPQPPRSMAERLQLPVEAEFVRTPLQEAVDFIAGEMGVTIEIDGDALKDAGYTKNMAQTFNVGKVSAERALWEILRQYQEPGKEMVISLDENRNTILLLTRKFAEQRGIAVYSFDGVGR